MVLVKLFCDEFLVLDFMVKKAHAEKRERRSKHKDAETAFLGNEDPGRKTSGKESGLCVAG